MPGLSAAGRRAARLLRPVSTSSSEQPPEAAHAGRQVQVDFQALAASHARGVMRAHHRHALQVSGQAHVVLAAVDASEHARVAMPGGPALCALAYFAAPARRRRHRRPRPSRGAHRARCAVHVDSTRPLSTKIQSAVQPAFARGRACRSVASAGCSATTGARSRAVSPRQIAPTAACSAALPPAGRAGSRAPTARSSTGRARRWPAPAPTRRGPRPSSIASHSTGLGRGCGHTGKPSAATMLSTLSWSKRTISVVL